MSEKAPILDEKSNFEDTLENLVANLGTGTDKRAQSNFVNNKKLSFGGNRTELDALYQTNWVAGKVVDIIPNDMTREWRSFIGDIDPEVIEALEKEEKRLALRDKFNEAHKWARLYGTAFIVLSVDDGQTPDKPLDISKVKKGGLRYINVIDRHRIDNKEVVPIADPLNINYGLPEFYRFRETSVVIHHSRLIRFDAVKLPFDEFRRNDYMSNSVIDRIYEDIINFSTVTDAAASMVYETNVDIVKVKGLMQYLQTAEGEKNLRKRFALAKSLKSFNNMLLLDSEESHETKSNTFAGLHELIVKYGQILSGGSDIPGTRLLGNSASGLNATGEGDLKNYYDKVASDQVIVYGSKLDYLDQIMAKSLGIGEDADLSYEFNSLFQMSPKETAELQFQNAQRDQIYLTNDIVTEATVAKELKQNGTYSNITDEDIEELEVDASGTDPEDEIDGVITNTDPSQATEQENENEES